MDGTSAASVSPVLADAEVALNRGELTTTTRLVVDCCCWFAVIDAETMGCDTGAKPCKGTTASSNAAQTKKSDTREEGLGCTMFVGRQLFEGAEYDDMGCFCKPAGEGSLGQLKRSGWLPSFTIGRQ